MDKLDSKTVEAILQHVKDHPIRVLDPYGILAQDMANDAKDNEAEGQGSHLTKANLAKEIMEDTANAIIDTAPNINVSKYAAKKLARIEQVKNSKKVREAAAVSSNPEKVHKKVSRNLLLAARNEQCTVVCPETGIVSILMIPAIRGKVFEHGSPLSSIANARGVVQEGYAYLDSLDTQIVAGLLLTLASDYDLFRYIPSATGAENNAILRTASKEKLIQACLLIESYVNSCNFHFLPKLSLIYDEVLKEAGVEARFTEWMRLVNEALEEPDTIPYDENALLDKPMRGIRELKQEYSKLNKEQKRVSSLKDRNFKIRAQFRKDMKEAKQLAKQLKDTASTKLVLFLSSLFNEETYLTVAKSLLDKVAEKLSDIETVTAARIIQILATDYDALRKENSIDDLDDPLMVPADHKEVEVYVRDDLDLNEEDSADSQDASMVAEETLIMETIMIEAVQQKPVMPEGLSFVEKMLWKKRNGV